ncbi:methyltransferase [Rhodococcoides corynebacterioides]|uniref:methyltransferase n=1 Tax=Rhodococcoides corynebacterioides TaxID=53972 RepID=UPI001C9B39C3|nr:methyltransferase [Rhodococcus corynebacterioides]MBY6350954.1 methyltransferase [Rhodococcus corynebacterioides]
MTDIRTDGRVEDSVAAAGRLVAMADLVVPNAIRTAATLGLADAVDAGATDVAGLADRTGTDPVILRKLTRLLTELGILTPEPFAVTDMGAPLRSTHPFSVSAHLSNHGLFGRSDLALVGLTHTVRTGESAHVGAFGTGYWDTVNESVEFVEALVSQGVTDIGWDAELVLEGVDWSQVRTVTDLGGNNGALLIALLERHDHLSGIVQDLPNLAAIAADRLAASSVGHRATAVARSFFEGVPDDQDVYLLSGVLADWTDDEAVSLLRTIRRTMRPDARVVVAEISLADEGAAGVEAAALALSIAATVPGPDRTAEDLTRIAERAGLQLLRTGPCSAVRTVLEFGHAPTGTNGGVR